MRRAILLLLVFGLAGSFAGAAQAQGKDPFRPPPAGGSAGGEAPDLGVSPGVPSGIPRQPGDGLARTGQDVDSLVGLGIVFVLLGSALRLTARSAGLSGRGGRTGWSPPRGRPARTLPYA